VSAPSGYDAPSPQRDRAHGTSTTSARRELYVYYRVGTRELPRALRVVEQAHAQLRAQCPSLRACVLRRSAEAGSASVTLMEIYRADEGIDDALQRRIDQATAALGPLLIGARHTEVFTPLAGDGA
jgi:hypothetical protein